MTVPPQPALQAVSVSQSSSTSDIVVTVTPTRKMMAPDLVTWHEASTHPSLQGGGGTADGAPRERARRDLARALAGAAATSTRGSPGGDAAVRKALYSTPLCRAHSSERCARTARRNSDHCCAAACIHPRLSLPPAAQHPRCWRAMACSSEPCHALLVGDARSTRLLSDRRPLPSASDFRACAQPSRGTGPRARRALLQLRLSNRASAVGGEFHRCCPHAYLNLCLLCPTHSACALSAQEASINTGGSAYLFRHRPGRSERGGRDARAQTRAHL